LHWAPERPRFTLIAIDRHDVTGPGLGVAQLELQPNALGLGCGLAFLSRVPRRAAT
jgi:hypothetical protein